MIGYNTQKVSAADAPKTWKDLADAKWKGKLVHAHPGYSGVVMTGIIGLLPRWAAGITMGRWRRTTPSSSSRPRTRR